MLAAPSDGEIEQDHPAPPRLHRSDTDRMCCGVCGGIAEYVAVDPSLVRLAFVIATLWGGIGLVLYVVMAVVLPVDVDADATLTARQMSPERSRVLAGLALVVLGGLLLAGNMGLAPWLNWNLFWPTVLILIGVALLVRQPWRAEV